MTLAAGSMGLVPAARAANDTARFDGRWKTSFPYNGQTVTMVSIHEGSGFKNYVLVPNGAMPAGNGTFSAANGKWTASADKPNDSGTYRFTDANTVVCTNAVGQAVVWQRDNAPLPPVITPPPAAPDYQQRLAKYRKAADAGDANAMNSLGLMYENGQGVPRDYRQAMAWYRKAADGGSSDAALQLGFFYGTGRGVPLDYQQAMVWYRKAADAGNVVAMRNIGILYWDGTGVPMDHGRAVYWCRKAAAGGDQRSQEWLRENGISESAPQSSPMSGNGVPTTRR
jgi:TPR repeat protein